VVKQIEAINKIVPVPLDPAAALMEKLIQSYPTPRWFQFYILTQRNLIFTSRNRRPVRIGFLRHVVIGLLYGVVYYNLADDTDVAVFNGDAYDMRVSLTFFSVLFITLVQQQTIPTYFADKILLESESRRAKAYSVYPFWFSSWCIYLPQLIVNTVTFGALVYLLAGYRASAGSFFFYILILCLTAINGYYICQVTAALSPSPQTAMSVYPVIVFTLTAVSGYFIGLKSLPKYMYAWAPWISPMRYALQSVVQNEFENNDDLPRGDEYLYMYGFDTVSKEKCVLYLLLLCFLTVGGLIGILKLKNLR
jgi:hypothetical protein